MSGNLAQILLLHPAQGEHMNVLWRLKMDRWHLLFVLMVLSTCLVCQHASAQDNAARTKIFLDVDMKQSPVRQPHHGPEATQHMPFPVWTENSNWNLAFLAI
jgi:hypothetical protein